MANAVIEGGTKDIYSAVLAVRKALPALQKNGTGPQTQGSYKFLSIDDILEKVKPLEDANGIISYPVDHAVTFHYNTGPESKDGRVSKENVQGLVDFVFRYVAVSDGSYIDVSVPGEGIDSQDKATRKATTQAQKIANITLYNIITGEADPDGQDGGAEAQNVAPQASAAQRKVDQAKQAVASKAPAAGGGELAALNERIRKYIGTDTARKDDVNARISAAKETNGGNATAARKTVIADLKIGEDGKVVEE